MDADYTITLYNNNNTATIADSNTYIAGSTHYCGTWCNHTYSYPSIWWSTPATIYKYQIKCPKCKKNNWLELDTITPCTKCSSTLKAVSKSVDYEIEVE